MPSFASGYAIGEESERPDLWKILACAWAGFLGKTGANPLPAMFGKGIRRGPVSAKDATAKYTFNSEEQDCGSVWGNARKHVVTVSEIDFGFAETIFPDPEQATVLIGARKTTAVFNNSGLFGNALGNYRFGAHCPWSDQNIYWDYAADRISFNTTGHTWQQDHVYGFSAGPLGLWLYIDGRCVAGQTTPPGSAAMVGNFFTLGNYAANLSDDVAVSFLYAFGVQLNTDEIARISCDPGALFRPAPRAVGKPGNTAARTSNFFFLT